jgi:cobalt/nickel transport system permease protein
MELLDIEREALKDSIIHKIDARVKVVSFILIVLFAVFIGRSGESLFVHRMMGLGMLEIYLLAILFVAGLNKSLFLKRVALILPFGGGIVALKPFIEDGTILYALPLGITVTYEGILESVLLLSIMLVSISSVVVLSSTTTVQKLVESLRKMGAPNEVALLFGMTLRYIFLYFDVFQKIAEAQKTRCFSIRNKRVKLRFILKQIGYTIAMLFIRSYEQGLNIYQSMSSRGYSPDSTLVSSESKITPRDVSFAALTIFVAFSALLL